MTNPGQLGASGSAAEHLEGLVETVTFHSEETGFCVLKVKFRGLRTPAAVVGKLPQVHVGEWIKAEGHWVMDRQHGRQFQADQLVAVVPDTLDGIEKFLGSGLIKGIGPVYAKKLVEAFGKDVLEVIEKRSAELEKVEGIGPQRRAKIKASWSAQKAVREIMSFLMANGVSTAKAFRIYKMYGEKAIDTVRMDPYCLARDIRGIGFKTADEIAMRLGVEKGSVLRARAGLSYALLELSSQGHCAYPREALLGRAQTMLDIERKTLEEALRVELQDGTLRVAPAPTTGGGREDGGAPGAAEGDPWVYLAPLDTAEREVAVRLLDLAAAPHPCPMPPEKYEAALEWVGTKLNIELATGQKAAFCGVFRHKVVIITGGPGVGKTTLVQAIVRALAAKRMRIALAAPTGRAAKRMAELSGREAKTIHRMLEFDPGTGGFRRKERNPLEIDALIVDETSMLDVQLMAQLLRAIPKGALLVLVGDVDQLPSVGPGCVLRDLIESDTLPVYRLTEVFRQAAGSLIVRNAHAVNEGLMPELGARFETGGDFFFVNAEDPVRTADLVRRLLQEAIPRRFGFDPLRDIQVLTPMQKGDIGARSLNATLQAALNPPGPGKAQVEHWGWTYRTGDRVMQMENNYDKDVFNGDVGRIVKVDAAEGEVLVRYDDRDVSYDVNELDEVSLAYAVTVHKSQGSEYPCVVVPVHTQHYVMLQRNLLYTAITRGKKLVVLVGTKKAVALCVRNGEAQRRCTSLAQRLREAFRN